MKPLISDANILIDMEEGRLSELMFQLPYRFSIPDILYYEELDEDHKYLLKIGLVVCELESETMTYASELMCRYKSASRNDCLALALALQEGCPLLTGDKALRQAADNETVIVRGTLWIVEQLIRREMLSSDKARVAYERMKASGRRLPWSWVEESLAKLKAIET